MVLQHTEIIQWRVVLLMADTAQIMATSAVFIWCSMGCYIFLLSHRVLSS